MRAASSLRRFIIPALATCLFACQKIELQVLVNLTPEPIHVRLTQPVHQDDAGKRMFCGYESNPLRMAPEGTKPSNDYVDVVYTSRDPDHCEITFDVPAGYKVIIGDNQWCEDYAKHRERWPHIVPSPSALRIEGREGVIDLRGWQVARQFKRMRDGNCRMVYE